MAEGSIMELGVVIKAIDYFTGPLRSMVSSITAAEGKMKSITNTMKLMGKSRAEIEAINASLNKMADQKAFANIASDLQKAGMARQDIAAMEQSYMRMAQYQRDMAAAQAEYAAGKDLAMSGVGNLTTGAIGAFGIFELVKKAGEFQANMTVIKDSTGATTKQMNEFSDAVMNASAKVSKFNDMQMSQIAQTLTSGGFNKIGQAQSLLLPVAKFAESQMYEHKASDPIEITKQSIEMAHLFGHYDPKSFENFLNTFNKYSLMQPGDSTQLQQTIKYLAPTARTMHMKESDIMALAAVDNTLGLSGSHGGTNSADMILRLIPGLVGGGPKFKVDKKTGKVTEKDPKAWKAMKDLGFIDDKGNSKFFDKNGGLTDLNGMLTTMITDAKKFKPNELMAKYKDIFGIQGGRAASILANPRSLEQLGKMRDQLGKTKSMEQINNDLQKTPEGQLNLLKSNSMTLMLRVGQQLAISLNPAIAKVNQLLGGMLKFSEANPKVAKLIGDFALFAVGGKLAEGVVKILAGNFKMLSGAVNMFRITTKAGELTRFGKIVNSLKFRNAAGELTRFGKIATGLGRGLRTAGSAIGRFGTSALRLGGTLARGLGRGLLTTVRLLGRFGLALGRLGIQAAAWAVRMAASWLIAMGPVGWIIAGVTVLIAAGIAAWKTNFLGFRDKLIAVWDAIKKGAEKGWNGIKTGIGKVVDWIKGLPKQALQWGQNLVKMFADGITGGIKWVEGAVKSVGKTVMNFLGLHSPAKMGPLGPGESDKWAPNFMKMFAGGLTSHIPLVAKASQNAALAVKNNLSGLSGGSGSQSKLSLSGNAGGIIIQSGAIVIQGGNASPEQIAEMVVQKLGKLSRRSMMNAGTTVNMGAM
jgi:TP901 family phage tail tape measure protein